MGVDDIHEAAERSNSLSLNTQHSALHSLQQTKPDAALVTTSIERA